MLKKKTLAWVVATCLGSNVAWANAPALTLPPQIPVPVPQVQMSRGVPLHEFARLVLEDYLGKQFVMCPELLEAKQTVGVSTKLSPKSAEEMLEKVLERQGFVMRKGPIYYIDKSPEKAQEKLEEEKVRGFYKPKNRPVSYFADTVPPVFKEGEFSFTNSGDGKNGPGSGGRAGVDGFFYHITKKDEKSLLDLLEKLDTKVPMVAIRAMLMEVNTDGRDTSGVQLTASLLGDKLGVSLGGAPGNGANTITFKAGNFGMAFGAFTGDSRFKTIAHPHLITQHAQTADLTAGSQFPIITTTMEGTRRVDTPEYKDIGTLLKITPQVVGERITLSVAIELSDIAPTATNASNLPTLTKRALTSQVELDNKGTAILGGIQSTRETETASRFFAVPLSKEKVGTKAELVLVVQAEIVEQ